MPLSFNISDKFSWSDAVWRLMKSNVRDLGGYLSPLEPCKIDGSKRVRFLTLLVTVVVIIFFVISL